MTQPQLNALNLFCAEKVMGWHRTTGFLGESRFGITSDGEILMRGTANTSPIWSPTTDPAQAMLVFEKCALKLDCNFRIEYWLSGKYHCLKSDEPNCMIISAETLPLCIVKFAEKIFNK